MKSLTFRLIVPAAMSMAGVSAPAASIAAQAITTASTATIPDPQAVASLTAGLNGVFDAQPAKAASTDVEAALSFAIDQSGQPKAVVLAALDGLATKDRTTAMRAAIIRLRRRVTVSTRPTGTGGIGAPNSSALGAGPSVGGGANGTDYSPTP